MFNPDSNRSYKNLWSYVAHGPDNIPARLMKETAHNMTPLLALIYKASMHQNIFPVIGKLPMLPLFSRKGHGNVQLTTDQYP